MSSNAAHRARGLALWVLTAALIGAGLAVLHSTWAMPPGHEHVVFSQPLPNVPGKTLTGIVVEYAPSGRSPAHRHAGSVLAYVLSGAIRSENSATGPVRIYHAGESFFEPPGSTHLVSANASDREPASLLAIFVADTGAQLTRSAEGNRR